MLSMIHKAGKAMPRPENVPDKMEAAESAGQIPSAKYQALAAAALPPFIPARQRHHVLKAHLLERLRRQSRTSAAATVADDGLVLVAGDGIDFVFQLSARQRLCARNGAFGNFVGLADVDEREVLL